MNPILSVDSGMQLPLDASSGNYVPVWARIPGCAFRLGSHWESASHPALPRRFLYARALHRVRFSAVRGSVGAGHGRLRFDKHRIRFESKVCAENPRICFANPHRLRPPAGVLARGLKTLTRFPNARALHRVRFSAVRTRNKKAGRYKYLPACYLWWRRGESNSGPRKPPDWHLQAQSLVLSRTLCAQRHARGVLTGSVLACAIPITCAGAFP